MDKIYRILFSVLNVLFPKIYKKDLTRLTKTQKSVVALKYWLTIKLLH